MSTFDLQSFKWILLLSELLKTSAIGPSTIMLIIISLYVYVTNGTMIRHFSSGVALSYPDSHCIKRRAAMAWEFFGLVTCVFSKNKQLRDMCTTLEWGVWEWIF